MLESFDRMCIITNADICRDAIASCPRRPTFAGNMYSEWLTRYIAECGGIETMGWHAFLSGMLRAPPEDIVVKKLIKSPRGGSGNNPFLADR